MRKIIFGSLIAFIVVAGALLVERSVRLNRAMPKTASDGQVLPADASVKTFPDGKTLELSKFKGKVVLVNFWATWCSACVAEMPSMVRLYSALHKDGLEIAAVSVDDEPEKVVPEFVKKLSINFPIYSDPDNKLAKMFDVVAIPFSAMISKEGKIIWSESGERDWSSEEAIAEIRGYLK